MTSVFGVDLDEDDQLPEGWTPLEVVVTIKCLDEEGEVKMEHFASSGLNTWEAWGMSQWTADTLRNGLHDEGDEE
jgi:hypothetical protein